MIEIQTLKVKEICESPMNPRTKFEKADIEELAKNIKQQGLLQPITVRPIRDVDGEPVVKLGKDGTSEEFKYEVVCGARRFRAVNKLGWHAVQAIVREMTEEEAFDAMITENLQRKDVSPIDEALAFSELLKKGQSVKEIATRFGKSERYIQDRTKLCGLIDELKKELVKGHIPLVGAIFLSKCDEETQRDFYNEEIDGNFDEGDEDAYPFYDIKEWVTRSFRRIEGQEWWREDEGKETWNDESEVPKCKPCECNTANHGCLFYEMKGEPQCTKESCFSKKEVVFRKWKLMQMYEKLLKNGEEYTPDKTIVIEKQADSWKSDEQKKELAEKNAYLKESIPNVCIMREGDFNGKSWYKEDDERLQKMLSEGKVVRTVVLYDDWRTNEVTFYYKKGVNSQTATMSNEDLKAEAVRKAKQKNHEKMDGELMELIKSLTAYDIKGNSEMSKDMAKRWEEVKELLMWSIIFNSCSYEYKNNVGIGGDEEKLEEFLSNKDNREDMLAFAIKDYATRYTYYSMGGRARRKMVEVFFPAKFKEVVEKYENELEKALAKIDEKYG